MVDELARLHGLTEPPEVFGRREETYDRLRGMGAVVTVVNQMTTELVDNFGTPDGQKAQKIMFDEIISKLGQ